MIDGYAQYYRAQLHFWARLRDYRDWADLSDQGRRGPRSE